MYIYISANNYCFFSEFGTAFSVCITVVAAYSAIAGHPYIWISFVCLFITKLLSTSYSKLVQFTLETILRVRGDNRIHLFLPSRITWGPGVYLLIVFKTETHFLKKHCPFYVNCSWNFDIQRTTTAAAGAKRATQNGRPGSKSQFQRLTDNWNHSSALRTFSANIRSFWNAQGTKFIHVTLVPLFYALFIPIWTNWVAG